MHKHKLKCRIIEVIHRGLPEKNITKLAIHHGDTIIKTPSFPIIQMTPWFIIIPIWYALMQMMQQIINKATTTLKIEYRLRTNKLALMTNVQIYVSTSSRKVLSPNNYFSYTIPRCLFILFYQFNLYSK